MSSSFPFVPHISVLYYILSATVLRFKYFCKPPMQSVCLYLQVREWLAECLDSDANLQIFSRTVDCNTLVSTAGGMLKCCQKAVVFNFDFGGTPQLLHFWNLYYKQESKIVRYLKFNHSLFWWTAGKETEVFQKLPVSVTWKRMNCETKCTTLWN